MCMHHVLIKGSLYISHSGLHHLLPLFPLHLDQTWSRQSPTGEAQLGESVAPAWQLIDVNLQKIQLIHTHSPVTKKIATVRSHTETDVFTTPMYMYIALSLCYKLLVVLI